MAVRRLLAPEAFHFQGLPPKPAAACGLDTEVINQIISGVPLSRAQVYAADVLAGPLALSCACRIVPYPDTGEY